MSRLARNSSSASFSLGPENSGIGPASVAAWELIRTTLRLLNRYLGKDHLGLKLGLAVGTGENQIAVARILILFVTVRCRIESLGTPRFVVDCSKFLVTFLA